jgi:hypothetical protein
MPDLKLLSGDDGCTAAESFPELVQHLIRFGLAEPFAG